MAKARSFHVTMTLAGESHQAAIIESGHECRIALTSCFATKLHFQDDSAINGRIWELNTLDALTLSKSGPCDQDNASHLNIGWNFCLWCRHYLVYNQPSSLVCWTSSDTVWVVLLEQQICTIAGIPRQSPRCSQPIGSPQYSKCSDRLRGSFISNSPDDSQIKET